jgi:hypothetical protein
MRELLEKWTRWWLIKTGHSHLVTDRWPVDKYDVWSKYVIQQSSQDHSIVAKSTDTASHGEGGRKAA